jgi:hypothetical protein
MNKDLFGNERTVHCLDAFEWLPLQSDIKVIITSLPDMAEVDLNKDDWVKWVRKACFLLAKALSDDGVIFFFQTDRRYKGEIIDKKSIISTEYFDMGFKNIFSKIVLRQPPNAINFYRPTYSNLFGFSKALTGYVNEDVIYNGKMLYKNAMGLNACSKCIDFIKKYVDADTIVDPFCGQGSVLKMANIYGFNAIGVDILSEQCEIALTNEYGKK